VLVKEGVGRRGRQKPIFPSPLSLQGVLYSQSLLACFVPPLAHLPFGFSSVMHGIVIVSVEEGRGGWRERSLGSVDALCRGPQWIQTGGAFFSPSPFLSSQVLKGSAQAAEHPQMLWSPQVDIG